MGVSCVQSMDERGGSSIDNQQNVQTWLNLVSFGTPNIFMQNCLLRDACQLLTNVSWEVIFQSRAKEERLSYSCGPSYIFL